MQVALGLNFIGSSIPFIPNKIVFKKIKLHFFVRGFKVTF